MLILPFSPGQRPLFNEESSYHYTVIYSLVHLCVYDISAWPGQHICIFANIWEVTMLILMLEVGWCSSWCLVQANADPDARDGLMLIQMLRSTSDDLQLRNQCNTVQCYPVCSADPTIWYSSHQCTCLKVGAQLIRSEFLSHAWLSSSLLQLTATNEADWHVMSAVKLTAHL